MTREQLAAGASPLATKLKLLRGNPGKWWLNEDESEPEVRLPRPHVESTAACRNYRAKCLCVSGLFLARF